MWHETAGVARLLGQRFGMVQRVKVASVVGIIVGTLSVAGYADVLAAVRRVIADAGLHVSSATQTLITSFLLCVFAPDGREWMPHFIRVSPELHVHCGQVDR